MSRNNTLSEKVAAFDKDGFTKADVNRALARLKEFRQKFPFTENLRAIEWLDPDKLFKLNPDEGGEFFQFLEDIFKLLSYSTLNSSNIYRNTRLQISDFKNLLRIAVDSRKSLAQKVDAPWEKIGGIGQDKQLAKKIIFCFNYEIGAVLPIFNNQHLRHFANHVADAPSGQTKYLSMGQEYEHYTSELFKAKSSLPLTRGGEVMYFTRFLYKTYPPPDSESITSGESKLGNVVTDEQLDLQGFMKLLGELQKKGKVTGEEFRENRALWMQQKPNDRGVLTLRLKQLLNTETKTNPDPKENRLIQRRRL